MSNVSVSGDGIGDVEGPATSSDQSIARWNGVNGTDLDDSGIIIDDNDQMTLPSGNTSGIVFGENGNHIYSDGSDNLIIATNDTAAITIDPSQTVSLGNVNQVNRIIFDTSPTAPGSAEGTIYWDSTDRTLAVQGDESTVTLQVGQESQIRVRNESGGQINNGELVYFTGTESGGEERPLIALAQADAAATAAVIGIATQNIANNAYGYCTSFGLVRNIDTSSFTAGDPLYLSATVAGALTNVEPSSPNFSKAVGYAVKIDASSGNVIISVTPDTQEPAGDATELTVRCRKDSAGTINSGEVVYQTGYNAGQEVILVELADSDDATKMPALGIARNTFTNSSTGTVVVSGLLTGQDTSAYSVGDQLFVSTTAGALTNTRPTGATVAVQKMGQVIRSNITNGVISVVGAGRTNDIPNTQSDAYFRIVDDGDSTKVIQFQASGISGGTTRTLTVQDASGTIAYTSDITNSDWTDITNSAASGATVSFTSGLGTAYEEYRIILEGVSIDTATESIRVAFSDDAGSSYAVPIYLGATGDIDDMSGGATWAFVNPVDAAASTFNGSIIFSGNKTARYKSIWGGWGSSDAAQAEGHANGVLATSADVDAIQFSCSGAAVYDAGTIYIQGR